MEEVAVYASDKDRQIWVRSLAEFGDGRFEALSDGEDVSFKDVRITELEAENARLVSENSELKQDLELFRAAIASALV